MNKLIMLSMASALALATVTASAGDAAAGKAKSAACAACHGADGTSPSGAFPHLGGQYENYLLHALKGYKSGARQNAIMQGQVAALSEEDMKNLAAYYASQSGPLRSKK